MTSQKRVRGAAQPPGPPESGINTLKAERQKAPSPTKSDSRSNSSSESRTTQSPHRPSNNNHVNLLTEEYSLVQSDEESNDDYTPAMDKVVEDEERGVADIKAKLVRGEKPNEKGRFRLGELTRVSRNRDRKKAAAEKRLLEESEQRVETANIIATAQRPTPSIRASDLIAEQRSTTFANDRETDNCANPFSTLNAIERHHRGLSPLQRELPQVPDGAAFTNFGDNEDLYDVSEDENHGRRSHPSSGRNSNYSESSGSNDSHEGGNVNLIVDGQYWTGLSTGYVQAVTEGSGDPDSSDDDDDDDSEGSDAGSGNDDDSDHQGDHGGEGGDRIPPSGGRNELPDSGDDEDDDREYTPRPINIPAGNDPKNWSKKQLIRKLRQNEATNTLSEREEVKRRWQEKIASQKRRYGELDRAYKTITKRMNKMKMVLGKHLDRGKDLIDPHEALNKLIRSLAETMDPGDGCVRNSKKKHSLTDSAILRQSSEIYQSEFIELADSVQQPKAEWSLIWCEGTARYIIQAVIWRFVEDEVFGKPFEIWGKQRAKLFGDLCKEAPGKEDSTSLFGKKEVCSSLMAQLLDLNPETRTRHQQDRIRVVTKQLTTILSSLLNPKIKSADKQRLNISTQVDEIVRHAIDLGLVLVKGRASYEYARMAPGGEYPPEQLKEIKVGERLDDADTDDEHTDNEEITVSSIPAELSGTGDDEVVGGEASAEDSAENSDEESEVLTVSEEAENEDKNAEDQNQGPQSEASPADNYDYQDLQGLPVFYEDGRRRLNAQWMNRVSENITSHQGVDLIMSPALLKHGKIDFDEVVLLAHADVMSEKFSRARKGVSKGQTRGKVQDIETNGSRSHTRGKRQRDDGDDGEQSQEMGRGKRIRRAPRRYRDEII